MANIRPPSISTVSDSTVNSSVVAKQNNGKMLLDDHFEDDVFKKVYELDKKKVQVDQIGDVNHIYNFYTPPNNGKTKFH